MEKRPGPARAGALEGDAETGSETAESGRSNGHESSIAVVEKWTPPSDAIDLSAVRQYLTPGESLHVVDAVTYLDDADRPATAGLTDERILLVGDGGEFVDVGLDRVCAVRSDRRTTHWIRGMDYRFLLAVGYLLAIAGLVGVLGAAANPLTPTLAVLALGGVLATDYVLRAGADLDPAVAAVRRRDGGTGLGDRLRRGKARVNAVVPDDDLAFGATGGLALGTFLLVVVVEPGPVAPALTLLTVVGALLAVYAFRHTEEFDGMELVRRHKREVSATVEDGNVLVVRTHPDSSLDRELARLVHGRPGAPRGDERDH